MSIKFHEDKKKKAFFRDLFILKAIRKMKKKEEQERRKPVDYGGENPEKRYEKQNYESIALWNVYYDGSSRSRYGNG